MQFKCTWWTIPMRYVTLIMVTFDFLLYQRRLVSRRRSIHSTSLNRIEKTNHRAYFCGFSHTRIRTRFASSYAAPVAFFRGARVETFVPVKDRSTMLVKWSAIYYKWNVRECDRSCLFVTLVILTPLQLQPRMILIGRSGNKMAFFIAMGIEPGTWNVSIPANRLRILRLRILPILYFTFLL